MQIHQKNTFIQSFGGLNFINDFLKSHGLAKLLTGSWQTKSSCTIQLRGY